jgi:divalent metal cation (Fe/Co/Zn/Cd) transporter
MLVRIIMGLIMMAVGAFAFYTAVARPKHPWSQEPLDQAVGIPQIITRIIRAVLGLLFIGLGIVAVLRAFGIF